MGKGVSMRPAGRAARLAATVLFATCALMLVCARAALAAPPVLSIINPVAASSTDESQPSFQVTSTDASDPLTLELYVGASATGTPVQTTLALTPLEPWFEGAIWKLTPESPLAPGEYTAVVSQTNAVAETGESLPVTFIIDTAPVVWIDPIASPTKETEPTLGGSAANGVGDDPNVSVKIYEGELAAGTIVAAGVVARNGSNWEYTPATPLAEGTYTAVAGEGDEAGVFDESPSFTFTVLTKEPVVSITSPADGATLHVADPNFEGTATDSPNDQGLVTVRLYKGWVASGSASEEVVQSAGGHWALVWPRELANGTYTALATEEDRAGNRGESRAVTFKVKSVLTLETSAFEKAGRPGLVSGPRPSFQGSASEASSTVTVNIYSGLVASGSPARVIQVARNGTRWVTGPLEALAGGAYTAQVEQGLATEEFEFTVDATAPRLTLTSPLNGGTTDNASQVLSGAAGTEEGDIEKVTIHLYSGSAATGAPLQTISAEAVGPSWSATMAGLAPGTYTALAEQEDDVGNIGYSEAATFTVLAPPVAPTPSAPVSVTIPVGATVIPLMQPFPVVHVAGSFSSSGAKIGVLTVLAPVGATVRVTCKGGGCPPKGQRVRAVAGARSKASSVLITFHRFERALRTGAVLDVWISDAGEIGKFTRLVIRRDKPPNRTDLCLNPAGTAPLTCPAS